MIAAEYPQDAACLNDFDPDAWFPTGSAESLSERTTRAISLCRTCPVRVECGQLAAEREEEHGVWGGELHTRESVRRLRRSRDREARTLAALAAGLPAHLAVCAECPTEMSGATLGEVTALAGEHTAETGHAWTYSGPQTVSA